MDKDSLLTAVFESAVLRMKTGTRLTQALAEAEKEVIEAEVRCMQGEIRAERRALVEMLDEWQWTNQPVHPKWGL
jgi:hypothetical protein